MLQSRVQKKSRDESRNISNEVKIDSKETERNVQPSENSGTSINMGQLRRSGRERKMYYVYGYDSFYEFDDCYSDSVSDMKKKQKKTKAQRNVTTFKSNKSMQKQNSKKQTQMDNQEFDEKLKKPVIVKLERLEEKRTSSMQGNKKQVKKQDTTNGRGSTQNCGNISKKTGKKGTPLKSSKNKKKTQPEAVQSAKDVKITAKKGTLKYLQQRENYLECLAKEVQQDDDFSSDNAFFAKKKYKFTNLLPSSHEDTLTIMTPKRGKDGNIPNAAITPRTAVLGQLQPVTPTTEPYSPFPSLDKDTKQDALKQVYQFMKGKKSKHVQKSQPNSIGREKPRHLPFTPLELPELPENQSGNESETTWDEYFSGSEEF